MWHWYMLIRVDGICIKEYGMALIPNLKQIFAMVVWLREIHLCDHTHKKKQNDTNPNTDSLKETKLILLVLGLGIPGMLDKY